MRIHAQEIFSLVSAVVADPEGFPLTAIYTAIAEAEGGDPDAWVAHDPPTNPRGQPSSGLYQVHRPDWPDIYAATEAVRLDPMIGDAAKVMRMTELVQPIMADALDASAIAAQMLRARGFRVSAIDLGLFIDACWQTGRVNLLSWARSTRTGDAREIVNARRSTSVEVTLRNLAHHELRVAPAGAVAAAVIGGLALGAILVAVMEG